MSSTDNRNAISCGKDGGIVLSVCANCGKEGSDVTNTCNKCKSVMYCNAACKKRHRHKHKNDCERRVAELHDEKLFKRLPTHAFGSYGTDIYGLLRKTNMQWMRLCPCL